MKKIFLVFISLFLLFGVGLFSVTYAQELADDEEKTSSRKFTDHPSDLLKMVHHKANDDNGTRVQVTPVNNVTSNVSYCDISITDPRFTLTKTFCSIKLAIKWYLQYIIYIWLAWAKIFIIRNWFRIVTSTDREAQMKKFKTNMINLIIWVILLTSFYIILDVFVSVVNFIAWDN